MASAARSSGNPVACAAALGALEEMRENDLAGAARRIGSILIPRLGELAARTERIGEVRGRGAMVAIELVRPGTTEPDPVATAAVAKACHGSGVVVLTAGTYGNVLRLLPPLTIPEHLLHEALGVVEQHLLALG